jgi:multidrug efflux system membrane fusion protein
VVLLAAGAWIITGKFAFVGSEHEGAAEAQETAAAAEATGEAAPTGGAAPAATVRTVAGMVPVFAEHARKIKLSGVTEPNKRAVLAARADGVAQALNVTKGASVEAGQVVLALEGPETLARAQIAEIALAQRERDLEVAQRLFDGGNTPETQLTNARSARDSAKAELTLARASVDKLNLSAPFSGLVDAVAVELGEWVQTGTPVATILSLDPIRVRAEVSELDVGFVSPGATTRLKLVNGTEMEGKVTFVAREASASTRTFPVEVELPNPGNVVPSGMTTEVELFADPQPTVTVPRSIITLNDEGVLGLRVVGKDNVAHFVAVEIIDDTEAGLVVKGVPQDVRIITAGQDLVRDGETVIVSETAQVTP